MGKIAKGQQCNAVGCHETAIRSISPTKATSAGINIGNAKRAYLCKTHYRQFKKLSRKDRLIEKWRYAT